MSVDYYLACRSCRSAWQFFRSQAGGFGVDPSMIHRPADFWKWMTAHQDHGVEVVDEHRLATAEEFNDDYEIANRATPTRE